MTRRSLILGTAGHIDHGKTTLLRALTGIDTDRLPEEKRRGITIDIGFANLEIGPWHLGIVDVPGHERFIKNMLAGAAGIDIALLIVAADDSVMPQTREHLAILRLLDIQHGIVVITKCDRVEPAWLDMVEDDIHRLTVGTFLEKAPIVRTAVPGVGPSLGLTSLRDAIQAVCQQVADKSAAEVFRMPVDRAFSLQGLGTVVTGTVWSGQLNVRDEVEWLPPGKRLNVRGLQNHGCDAQTVVRGQRAAINLSGVHPSELVRGHELASPGYLVPSKLLTVELQVLGDSPRSIKHRSRQRLYVGTQELIVTVALLGQQAIEPGQSGLAQLHCAEPAIAVAGQPFVVRAESPLVTIGGGHVLQPRADRITRRQPARIQRLEALQSKAEVVRAATAIYFYAFEPWTALDLCRDANLGLDRSPALVEQLEQTGEVVELAIRPSRRLRVHRDVLSDGQQQLLKLVEQLHAQHPLQPLVPRERVAALDKRILDVPIIDALIDQLIERGSLRGDQRAVALVDFAPRLSTAQQRLREQILAALQQAGLRPPTPAELSQSTSADDGNVRQILDLCTAQNLLVYLSDELYLHQEAEAAMRLQLQQALREGAGLTVSQIRDLLGTSRKIAVQICEHLDRVGLTRRVGDLRVLR